MPSARYTYNVGLRFAQVAAEHGNRPALRGETGVVTYGELNRAANRVAEALQRRGVRHRDVVGIGHTKTTACYAAMLGCLKIGAAYVNLDDHNPLVRLAQILATARPTLVVVDGNEPLASQLRSLGTAVFDVAAADAADELRGYAGDEPEAARYVTGSDAAYVMYTSGSTGVPKGAVITHAGVLNFGAWARSCFQIEATDVLTNVNPMYFDNSVFDFYAALLSGASLVPIARELAARLPQMLDRLDAAGATIWFSVPSFLIYLMQMEMLSADRLRSLRAIAFGGEAYPKPELRKLFDLYGATKALFNVYGPTECTCICSAWRVTAADLDEPQSLVTLGALAENFSFHVLDDDLRPVAHGEAGELYLGGPQVGAGYINDPERTTASFVRNPLNVAWNETLYRTGDLVRVRGDGRKLDFVGRKDNQIKHMGYRIELEDIEAALNGIPGVAQSAAVQVRDASGLPALIAFVCTTTDISRSAVLEALRSRLPAYMIPDALDIRPLLPKNANGKIDRLALVAECAAKPAAGPA